MAYALPLSMARLDCRFCGLIGHLRPERVIQGKEALTMFRCDACGGEWDERDDDSQIKGRELVAHQ